MNSIYLENLSGTPSKITLVSDAKEANFITHNGTFHADEVMSLSILINLCTDIKLYRTTKLPDDVNAFIFDIGGGEFDHHESDFNLQRDNGIKYASCGLIWKKYGEIILKNIGIDSGDVKTIFQSIDKSIIMDIDRFDNGQSLIVPFLFQ